MNMRPVDCKQRSDDSKVHCQDYDPETGEQIILVQQEFTQECDINRIVDRFALDVNHLPMPEGLIYGDDSARPRYEAAKKLILSAEQSFDSLPAKIRKRFDNQPSLFLEFMDDPENREEAIRLGLMDGDSSPPEDGAKATEKVPPEKSLDITGGTDS